MTELAPSPDRSSPPESVPLTVVIVTYNVRDVVRQCLRSLGEEAEVFVVDNASQDGTVDAIRSEWPAVTVIANAQNRGFAAANNQALSRARGRYLCLLNPDTVLRPGALAKLQSALEQHPRLGMVGPRLLNPDGSLQSAGLSFPTWSGLLGAAVPWTRPSRLSLPADGGLRPCDWLIGACLLMRRQVLEEVGYLDEGYFMYGEEKDLCYRARQAGWQVACVPDAQVVHLGGQSADQVPVRSYLAFLDSQFRFLRKFYPPAYGRRFARATRVACALRGLAARVLARLQPARRETWRSKAELARAGSRRCLEYLQGEL